MDKLDFIYQDSNLYNTRGEAVMMEWERDWMKKSADIICKNGGDILNVGHGLGIIDSYIQEYKPASHTIIESHKDVISQLKKTHWYEKANIIESDWRTVIYRLPKFDGIYFDTWGDNYADFRNGFVTQLPYLLKKNGIFSYWRNTNIENEDVNLLCKELDLSIRWEKFDVNIPKIQDKNVKKTYIDPNLKHVLLPVITNFNEPFKSKKSTI